MSVKPERDVRFVLLTRLMRICFGVCLVFLLFFGLGEGLRPMVDRRHVQGWFGILWTYGTQYSLGFAAGSLAIALLLAQQRSALPRKGDE